MADLLSYALCSLDDVKESLGISSGDTSRDNLIIRKINMATLFIESYCNLPLDHHFKETTYTNEEYDGSGTTQLSLKMRPVTSITSFQRRDTSQNQDDWSDNETDLYFSDLNSGVIDLLFNQGTYYNNYRVTYTAGYSTIPADLAEACVMLASFYVENSSSGTAVKKKQEGQRSIEYFDSMGSGSDSPIGQLGIDDILTRYMQYNLADNK